MQEFYYDNYNRLYSATNNETDLDIDIKYDKNGNRKELTIMSSKAQTKSVKYIVNKMNQYTENTDSKFDYDKNGNMIKETNKKTNSVNKFIYSPEGKLIGSFIDSGDDCSFQYDCLELLIKMSCKNKGDFKFFYHYNQLLANKLSHIILPNSTIVYIIHIPKILPKLELTAFQTKQQLIHLPVLKSTILERLSVPPKQLANLPISEDDLIPIINEFQVLTERNIPFSIQHSYFYSPIVKFAQSNYQHNPYALSFGELSAQNYKNQIKKFYSNFFIQYFDVKPKQVRAMSVSLSFQDPTSWSMFDYSLVKNLKQTGLQFNWEFLSC